ncbi:unnamed protein product [Rangifer tarandus platyrhynchus]
MEAGAQGLRFLMRTPVVQTELPARNCAGLRSGHVSKERGACGPSAPGGGGRGAGPRGPPLWVPSSARGAVRASPELSRRLVLLASLGLPSLRPPRTLHSPPRLF